MAFSDEQLERYARHIIMPEIGSIGQEKLLNSKVLVIGTGGLGSPCTMYMAAAGVGTIGLVDFDKVDLSNLQRQVLHHTGDVGKLKVLSGKETINEINPDVNVVTYNELVNPQNIMDIIKDRDYDFIIDAVDNFTAKFLINDACVMLKKPFSHAGVTKLAGQTMTYVPGEGPCYRCVFKNPPPENLIPSGKQTGILGVIPGTIGTIQATEALKYILGIGKLLTGTLLTYDSLTMEFRKIKLSRRKDCQVCGENPSITDLSNY